MLRVKVINDQEAVPLNDHVLRLARASARAACDVAAQEGMLGAGKRGPRGEVVVCFMDDESIRELNARYLGSDQPTDVLAFPMDEGGISGDIAISVETASRQAAEYGHGVDDEICLLVAHGVLHLAGYDDDTEERAAKMRNAESKVLASLGYATKA